MTNATIAESHRRRLGCSEIAAALGASRWKTPYQLWLEKTGRVEPANLTGVLRVELGNQLEDVVANLYAQQTQSRLGRRHRELTHADLPQLVGHLDRRIIGARRGLEIKTHLTRFADDAWGEAGTDQIPTEYLLQVHGYLMLTGWTAWDVAVLLAGPELRTYTVLPDATLHDFIKMGISRFWAHVETDVPPEPGTLEDASARWPKSLEKPVAASAAARVLARDLRDAKSAVADLQKIADDLELQLKVILQNADTLVDYDAGKTLATWKTQTSERIDIKRLRAEKPDVAKEYSIVTENRVFRLRNEK